MTFDHYHAYPFPIKETHDFILTYPESEQVTGEIFVYWIGEENSLLEPKEENHQK